MEYTNQNGLIWSRHNFSATVSHVDLVESYDVAFQAAIETGNVMGLMCSYNAVNGVPSCANQEHLAQQWGFNGYITSDCGAEYDVFFNHNFTKTPELAVKSILQAGVDVNCGNFMQTYAPAALKQGIIAEADLDIRIRNLLKVRFRLGHFNPLPNISSTEGMCLNATLEVAREGVTQSASLLKNSKKTLPLAKGQTIAVIGPNGASSYAKAIAPYYGPKDVCGNKFWSVVNAVSTHASSVSFAPGVSSVGSNDLSMIPAAVKAAQSADLVVLVCGTDLTLASEGKDAERILFSEGQMQLIEKVSAAAVKPVVLLVFTATPLDLSPFVDNPKIGAIVHAGQPGVQVIGLAPLLFGERSFSGRLVQTIYPASYQNEISIFDFRMAPGPSVFKRPDCTLPNQSACSNGTNPGRTYRFYNGKPVFEFGFGLSYTNFTYKCSPKISNAILIPQRRYSARESLKLLAQRIGINFRVNVTNTGQVDADDVVLGFIRPPGAGKDNVPKKFLFGFERVFVPAGETRQVILYPELRHILRFQTDYRRVVIGRYHVEFGVKGTSSGVVHSSFEIK